MLHWYVSDQLCQVYLFKCLKDRSDDILLTCYDIVIWTCIFQPQKKKKDRRKGKGGDADDDDDDDVMLKLKKLSVQASDEEDEPGMKHHNQSSQWNQSYPHIFTHIIKQARLFFPQPSLPVKEARMLRFVIRLHCAFSLHSWHCWQY